MSFLNTKNLVRRLKTKAFLNLAYEEEFRETYRIASLRVTYISSLLSIFSLIAFVISDLLLYNWSPLAEVSVTRYFMLVTLIVWAYFIKSYPELIKQYHYEITSIFIIGIAFSIYYVEYKSQIFNHLEFTYTSLMAMCSIVLFVIYGFLRLSTTLALALALVTSIGPFLCVLPHAQSFYGMTRMASYIATVNLMGFILHRIIEINDRYIFIKSKKIDRLAQIRERILNHERESSQVKTRFLAMISHELRTPIAGLMGITNILHDDVLLRDPAKHQLCTALLVSCERLLGTFNDLIEYAKDSHTHREKIVKNEVFDLEKILRDTCNLFLEQRSTKKIDFKLDLRSAKGIVVFSDPSKISRILLNLLNNAWKFTPINGYVKCHCVCVPHGDQTVSITLTVTDSGIGIPKDQLDKIWQPFYQVDSSLSRSYQGTGLGLAICKELVDSLGGEIFCNSVVERGSAFSVDLHLPLANFLPVPSDEQAIVSL